jgi:chromosomal replication initiator protein
MKQELTEFCIFLSDQKVIKNTVNHDDIIKKFIKLHTDKRLGLTDIVQIVSIEAGISVETMKLKTRKREIVEARQIAMWMLNHYTKLSLESIGGYFESEGHKFDHATVLHAIKTVNNLRQTDKELRDKFEKIKSAVEYLKSR